MRIWETVYDSLVGTDVLGGPIRKRLGQVKNITLAEQTSCKPITDPAAARISEHLRFCLLRCAKGRILDPQKFDCVRMPRCDILSALRMTQRGRLARCVCVAGRQGADPLPGVLPKAG